MREQIGRGRIVLRTFVWGLEAPRVGRGPKSEGCLPGSFPSHLGDALLARAAKEVGGSLDWLSVTRGREGNKGTI